jgi:hypothetical protein
VVATLLGFLFPVSTWFFHTCLPMTWGSSIFSTHLYFSPNLHFCSTISSTVVLFQSNGQLSSSAPSWLPLLFLLKGMSGWCYAQHING